MIKFLQSLVTVFDKRLICQMILYLYTLNTWRKLANEALIMVWYGLIEKFISHGD